VAVVGFEPKPPKRLVDVYRFHVAFTVPYRNNSV